MSSGLRRAAPFAPSASIGSARAAVGLVLAAVVGGLAPVACDDPAPGTGPVCTGEVLFGRPNEKTGLTAEDCNDRCESCEGGPFRSKVWDAESLAALRRWPHLSPYPTLDASPYDHPAPEVREAEVCAVLVPSTLEAGYELATFRSWSAAEARGGIVTHTGPCGLCSTLENLAVYAEREDLTDPVRACGIVGLEEGFEANVECLRGLGFDLPCAQIWAYNTQHTRQRCLEPCLRDFNAPYHLPDGQLNECLVCDEVESGPVFKAIAGRTRRNSGLANAMCRPCSEVHPIAHDYGP